MEKATEQEEEAPAITEDAMMKKDMGKMSCEFEGSQTQKCGGSNEWNCG